MLSKYQRFEVMTINRQQIKKAPYNPRIIDKNAKDRLKQNLKKHGLVETLVWNKRTGVLVSGHQRLDILDSLERSGNYELQVSVVDVDETEEKSLNVVLNNPGMQGEWDLEKLKDLKIDFKDLGFVESEVDYMFGSQFSALFQDSERVIATEEKIKEIKNVRAGNDSGEAPNFFVTVVCADNQQREDFLREIGIPINEKFITLDQLMRLKDGNKVAHDSRIEE